MLFRHYLNFNLNNYDYSKILLDPLNTVVYLNRPQIYKFILIIKASTLITLEKKNAYLWEMRKYQCVSLIQKM